MRFKDYVTEDCEYIDVWNGETEGRFVGSRSSSLNSTMTSISNFMSEEQGVDAEILIEEERFFKKHVHIYKNN